VKDNSGVCPLMISTNNGNWFSILISLLEPVNKKSIPDQTIIRRNSFKDGCRVFDIPM
jgi:hypothetical protein